ncbi:diguanylate cyclase domain-containing protein [Anabaena azotica]|uniref:Diguanylate cyclase n=1 Tax=Anabaena azotica FACHB-119 TaxID=947527 RepID=A0ABR8D2D0_9NOST|nr:diguanylate cyclase [Anabaena azotica]MBD2501340.1 diguanylate cyclase [Anabaena azotica FACHB-119]
MNWQFPNWRNLSWLLPGSIASLIFLLILKLGILNPLERLAYISLFQLRGEIPWSQQVVVIGIDDASIQQLGRFPWPRQQYTTLLQQLSTAKPNLVVFDMVFSETTGADPQLAQAMQQHGLVVIAQAWDYQGKPWLPTTKLQAAAIDTGHISKSQDADGITRQISPQIQGIPALGLITGQIYSSTWEHVHIPNLNEPLWLNYPGKIRHASVYSFADVVQGKIPAQTFKDKIVLVGVTAIGIDSVNSTPFERDSRFSGVYLHAVFINNLLQQNFLRRFQPESLIILLVLINISWSLVITRWHLHWQLLGWLGGCLGYLVVGVFALKLGYWLLPVASAMIFLSLTTVVVIINQQFQQAIAIQYLKRQINIDGLTQIANRRCFNEYFHQEWRRAAREQTLLSLIICDVDFFKKYNDSYGHQAGDICLQQVAQALQQSIKRPADLVARYGGEEFVVILPNTNAQGAIHIAEIMRTNVKALEIPHIASEVSEYVSLSIGIATTIPDHQDSEKTLIETADQGLYTAKQKGRDQIVFQEWRSP